MHLGIACLHNKGNSRGGCACGKVKQLQTQEAAELPWDPLHTHRVSQVALVVQNQPAKAGDPRDSSSTPGLGRSPGGGHENPLQYSCLESPHGQRSLVGYSPPDCKESDMTEAT